MKIRYNPAVELLCAMLQYAHWRELAESGIPGYRVSPELEKWYGRTKSEISGLLDNDLSYLIKNFLGLVFLPIELALTDGICSPVELIEAFRALPPEGLPERMFRSYSIDKSWDSVKDDPALIVSLLEKAGGTTRKREPEFFLDFAGNPGAVQERLAGIMEDFYHQAVRPYEDEVRKKIEMQISEDQVFLDSNPEAFYTDVFRSNPEDAESGAEIYISYYNEIDIIQLDDPLSFIYGRVRRQLSGSIGLPLEQIYSLLSDERRKKILQLLCRKSWFIRELADYLDITSATVSYHMSRLGALNLVTCERGERKRIYYRADTNKVEAMLDAVKLDILGNERGDGEQPAS